MALLSLRGRARNRQTGPEDLVAWTRGQYGMRSFDVDDIAILGAHAVANHKHVDQRQKLSRQQEVAGDTHAGTLCPPILVHR